MPPASHYSAISKRTRRFARSANIVFPQNEFGYMYVPVKKGVRLKNDIWLAGLTRGPDFFFARADGRITRAAKDYPGPHHPSCRDPWALHRRGLGGA